MRVGDRVRDARGEWGTIVHVGDFGCVVSYADNRAAWAPTETLTLHPDDIGPCRPVFPWTVFAKGMAFCTAIYAVFAAILLVLWRFRG